VLLVLWDIDGTLVDSAGQGARAFDEAYEAVVGRPPPGPVAMAGRTDHQIATAMLESGKVTHSDDRLPRMLDALASALAAKRELIRAEGHAHPGARQALAALARRPGVVQSLLTGNLEANAAVKLSAFGLERYLDLEVGGYGSDPHRARSDLVAVARRRAAAKYGAEPEDVVLVGDTPLDVRAAREAGARCVAVASGPHGPEELRAAGADAVLADLTDTGTVVATVTGSAKSPPRAG
jgi:phosphoglycolate phosphatase-like HAD superfamily hydrolase